MTDSGRTTGTADLTVALTTYSVKPRGGVVHTLELAEALQRSGVDVTVVALGDPDVGFFRAVDVPVHIVPAPEWGDTLDERVFRWIDAMTEGLDSIADRFDIMHSQDCISARAAARVRDQRRDAGQETFQLIRTVHHVDDFTTQALMDCQRAAIVEPDRVLVVSDEWKTILAGEYGVGAHVVTNGVRTDRFARPIATARRHALRASIGTADRFLFLTVGGIEPRKGSEFLIDALARCKAADPAGAPALAVIGGHSFQDYRAYRERVLGSMDERGLELGRDVVLLGTVDDDELVGWFKAADGFVFPSVKEGWGLVVLEAMAAGLPPVTSDLDVFGHFVVDEQNALITTTGDAESLAAGMARLQQDDELRARLSAAGPDVARGFSWDTTARQHLAIYRTAINRNEAPIRAD